MLRSPNVQYLSISNGVHMASLCPFLLGLWHPLGLSEEAGKHKFPVAGFSCWAESSQDCTKGEIPPRAVGRKSGHGHITQCQLPASPLGPAPGRKGKGDQAWANWDFQTGAGLQEQGWSGFGRRPGSDPGSPHSGSLNQIAFCFSLLVHKVKLAPST